MSLYHGKYRGLVRSATDEEKRGRIKVVVPAVLGELEVWALPCVPFAGAALAAYWLPDVGDAVWVEFEGGDPSFPIWVGSFWGNSEIPEAFKPEERTLRVGGATLKLVDVDSEPTIELAIGEDVVIQATADGVLVTVGTTRLELHAGVELEAESGGTIEISDGRVGINNRSLEVR